MQSQVVLLLLLNIVMYKEWLGLVVAQTLPPPRAVLDIANPLVDLEKCGRKGMRSHVCDPDGIIPVEQAYQLDDLIRSIYNDTQCPCIAAICRPEGQGGYLIGIAIIRAMKLNLGIRRLNYSREDQAKYMDAVLNEAKRFAFRLLDDWKMGRCAEDILIFFSEYDNVLYTITRPEARKKLTDDIVSEIAVNSRIYFSHRETVADGFKEILIDYRRVLLSIYQRKSSLNSDPSEIDHPLRAYGSEANNSDCCLLLPLVLFNSAALLMHSLGH